MKQEKDLRIIFIGTPDFAVESLRCIHESGRNVVAVITAPDRKAGRGQKLQESAVKKYALANHLEVLQPTNLKSPEFIEELKAYKADIQVVVAFRMLPEVVWNMPPLGTFNLHASLLPQYRGAAPINWAIINGEQESGVSTFFLKHQIDTGDLLLQEKVPLAERETAGSLHDKLMEIGGQLVLKSLEKIESGDYQLLEQSSLLEEGKSNKEAPKIFKEDCRIDWQENPEKIDRLIRGMSPYPTAWTTLISKENNEKQLNLKIFQAQPKAYSGEQVPGSIVVEGKNIMAICNNGALLLEELQVEGKKRMNAVALLNGFDIAAYSLK
jgi:methionyl-tRNA formyltransferase